MIFSLQVYFTTTALQQSRVNLTWEESDPRRAAATEKAFARAECEQDDEAVM